MSIVFIKKKYTKGENNYNKFLTYIRIKNN